MKTGNPHDKSTVIGFFSDAWDATAALEDLTFAGFGPRLRYIQNDHHPQHDSSKHKPSVSGFIARIYGLDSEEGHLDSRGNWTVNPEAEAYFTEAFERKNHVILIQVIQDADRAIEILHKHHAKVGEENFAFFAASAEDNMRVMDRHCRSIGSNYHQTASLEPPLESGGS